MNNKALMDEIAAHLTQNGKAEKLTNSALFAMEWSLKQLAENLRAIEDLMDQSPEGPSRTAFIQALKASFNTFLEEEFIPRLEREIHPRLDGSLTKTVLEPINRAYIKNSDFDTNEALQKLLLEVIPAQSAEIFYSTLADFSEFIKTSRYMFANAEERIDSASTFIEKLLYSASNLTKKPYPNPHKAGERNGFATATQKLAESMKDLLKPNTLLQVNRLEQYDLNGLDLHYSLPKMWKCYWKDTDSLRSRQTWAVGAVILYSAYSLYYLFTKDYGEAPDLEEKPSQMFWFCMQSIGLMAFVLSLPLHPLDRPQALVKKKANQPFTPEIIPENSPDVATIIDRIKNLVKTNDKFKNASFEAKILFILEVKNDEKKVINALISGVNDYLLSLLLCVEMLIQIHAEAKVDKTREIANETLLEVLLWATANEVSQRVSIGRYKLALLEQLGKLHKLPAYKPSGDQIQTLIDDFLNSLISGLFVSASNTISNHKPMALSRPWGNHETITLRQYREYIQSHPSEILSRRMLNYVQPLTDFLLTNKTIIKDESMRRNLAFKIMSQFIKRAISIQALTPMNFSDYIKSNATQIGVVHMAKNLSSLLTKEQVLSLKEFKQFDLMEFEPRLGLLEWISLTLKSHHFQRTPVNTSYTMTLVVLLIISFFIGGFYNTKIGQAANILCVLILGSIIYSFFKLEEVNLSEKVTRFLSPKIPLEAIDWIDDFEETPIPEPKIAPTSPEKSPSPPLVVVSALPAPPVVSKPRIITDWTKVADQLTSKFHQFKKSLANESEAAKSLFNTSNADKKAKMHLILKHLQSNPEIFYHEETRSLLHNEIEQYILDECNNTILTSGEAKIVRGVQPPPPVEVVPPPVPAPAPAAPIIPLPLFPIASSSSSSSATKTLSTSAYAKSPDNHKTRLAGNVHRYGPHTAPLPPSDLHHLAMKFDLLDLCERLKQLCPLQEDRINRIRNGLLHHDASIEMNLKFETYQGLLRDFAADYMPDSSRPAEGLLRSRMADPQAWIMRERANNTIEGIAPIDYFSERCQSVVLFYDQMMHKIESGKSPSLPRKAMMMSIIEIGVLFSHMILQHQNLSLLMPMEQVKLFTDFRISFCHIDVEASLKDIQQNLQSIYEIVTEIVKPGQSSRLAAAFT